MTARAGVQGGHVHRVVINGYPAGSSDGRYGSLPPARNFRFAFLRK